MFSDVSMAVATKHDNTNPGLLHFCCKTQLTFSQLLTWLNLCGVVCKTAGHCSVWEASHLPLRTPSICFLQCHHTAAAAAIAVSSRTHFHCKGMQGILCPFHPCPHDSVQSHEHFVWCVLMKHPIANFYLDFDIFLIWCIVSAVSCSGRKGNKS